ncbi:MAG: EamA family transporter [Pelagibacteraceae bacterium]|jgi:drug/metabolite transporter (DMT)-like permease|nr:EamA family transporter [Pelagibacteraceae bacterium]MBO6468195.1 EamA family transporter [Pelagibacteraceae bacterium]MBO6469923.1 EamA family transporter [Pelagibacteraceae bacterium]MBO6470683.1 EamA family transporter [Pelagibacteraceae bacterium]|tara:strand:- start:2106 stop:2948 length:843 start_codon:yes stop_codon:yes gene_type:complete
MSESNIFFLILFAATLHAGWNLIIKSFTNSLSAIGFKLLFQSIIFIPFIFFVPLPTGITWFFIIGSVVLHNYYFINLGISYNKGDLSYVYPISRGCSPIFVTILSSLFLQDKVSSTGWIGILIVSFGLLLLTFTDIKNKINLDVLKLALIISFTISLYTLCDGAGVRSVDNNFSYIVWLFVLDGWLIFAYIYYKNKNDLLNIQLKGFGLIILASIMSCSAYGIIIWSMNYTEVGYVSSIRGASIIIATLFGFIFLKEKFSFLRIISAIIFFLGISVIYIA